MAPPIRSLGLLALLASSAVAVEENFLQISDFSENEVKASFTLEEAALSNQNSETAPHHRLEKIESAMSSMYSSLPKTPANKITHQAVRYALHRYFEHRYGWFIRGVEPTNDTWHGEKTITKDMEPELPVVKEWVPTFLQTILEKHLGHDGADLGQLAVMAAALEDLVKQEAVKRLKIAYEMYEYKYDKVLTRDEAEDLMQTYYVGFLNAWDFNASSRADAMQTRNEFITDYTGWAAAYMWFEELTKKELKSVTGPIGFDSLAGVAMRIGEEYFSFNDRECVELKTTLRKMQGKRAGRVLLSQFYHSSMYSHWDFSEKKEYLRALGALDESDPKHPAVIIANYAMARPNCLDTSNLYTICCTNECEELMGALESELGTSTAPVDSIASIVRKLPTATVSAPHPIPEALMGRLEEIAERHDGEVPLHGRLFQQWMHHVFPLECPFPHEMGTVNALSRGEWLKETGHESEKASTQEMLDHIAEDTCAITAEGSASCADESAELPWSSQEELVIYHSGERPSADGAEPSPQASRGLPAAVTACVVLALLIAAWALVARYTRRRAYEEVDLETGLIQVRNQARSKPIAALAVFSLAAYAVGLLDGQLLVFALLAGVFATAAEQRASRGNASALKAV